MGKYIWNGDRDSLPKIGDFFEFKGIIYEATSCPCGCGRIVAIDFNTLEENMALTILMRGDDYGHPEPEEAYTTAREMAVLASSDP